MEMDGAHHRRGRSRRRAGDREESRDSQRESAGAEAVSPRALALLTSEFRFSRRERSTEPHGPAFGACRACACVIVADLSVTRVSCLLRCVSFFCFFVSISKRTRAQSRAF